jgi:protein-L-isoaspartate O-methyltransferase
VKTTFLDNLAEEKIKLLRGSYIVDPLEHAIKRPFDVELCIGLDEMFKGKHVLEIGAGVGHYARCLLHLKKPLFPSNPELDEAFFG